MTSPEVLPHYLDFSQFGMIRGPSPLPDTVSICEVGTFEHPDSDYTVYQVKIVLVAKYFFMLCMSFTAGSIFRFYFEIHNANRGLPFKTLFYDSLLCVLIFLPQVIIPGTLGSAIFQGAYFIGEPFSYVREWGIFNFADSTHILIYSIPLFLMAQYMQLKGRSKLPWWSLTPTATFALWSFCYNVYLLYTCLSILVGTTAPIKMMYAILIYRKWWARIHAIFVCCVMFVIFYFRAIRKRNPAGYLVVRPLMPLSIYAFPNILMQFSPALIKAIYDYEHGYTDPWMCFSQFYYIVQRQPVIIDGVKLENGMARAFINDDVMSYVMLGCVQGWYYSMGAVTIRNKFLACNLIKPVSGYYILFFQFLFMIWTVIPFHLAQREDFEIYFRTLMIIVWLVTAFLYLIRKEDVGFRTDWATAGIVRLEELKVTAGATHANVQFYLPFFFSVLSNALFVISLITSPLTPWKDESGLQSGDILARFDFDSGFIPPASITSLYFTVCIAYIIDYFISLLTVMFPPCNPKSKLLPFIEKYQSLRSFIRYFLFTVASLPALRLIISGIKCETIEGLKLPILAVSKDVYCNYYGYHLAAILMGLFIATWFVGFNNLRFASNVEQTARPFFARYPSSLMIENASALLLVAIRSFEQAGDGKLLASVGFIVILLNLVFYLTQWSFLQDARLIYLRCCAFSIIINFYLCALLAQAGPNQWWPIILLIVSTPFVTGGTYLYARKKFAKNEILLTIQDRSKMIVRTLCIQAVAESEDSNVSINLSDLSDSDMGVALCTDRLQTLTSVILKRSAGDSWDNKDQLNLIRDLERGFMTTLGLKSTDFDTRIIGLLSPYLDTNVPSQYRDPSIRILHRLHTQHVSIIKAELFSQVVRLFCFVPDAELHDFLADVITTCVGNDKILVYNSDENNKTPFHEWALTKDEDGVFEYQIPQRKVYMIPYHLMKKFTFEPRLELVHMSLSFPPLLMWDVDQFNTFNQAASLFIPQDAGVIKMDNVKKSSLESHRPPIVKGKLHETKYPKWRWILFTFDQVQDLNFDLIVSTELYRFLSGVITRYAGQEKVTTQTSTNEISPE